MIRSLMGLLGWSSERVAPARRAALGLESLDGRVTPSATVATIATPKLFLAAIADPPPRAAGRRFRPPTGTPGKRFRSTSGKRFRSRSGLRRRRIK